MNPEVPIPSTLLKLKLQPFPYAFKMDENVFVNEEVTECIREMIHQSSVQSEEYKKLNSLYKEFKCLPWFLYISVLVFIVILIAVQVAKIISKVNTVSEQLLLLFCVFILGATTIIYRESIRRRLIYVLNPYKLILERHLRENFDLLRRNQVNPTIQIRPFCQILKGFVCMKWFVKMSKIKVKFMYFADGVPSSFKEANPFIMNNIEIDEVELNPIEMPSSDENPQEAHHQHPIILNKPQQIVIKQKNS